MKNISSREIHDYIHELLPRRGKVLEEMEAYAEEHNFPIVGPHAGRFLRQLSDLKKPKTIFEMGSGFGYSAIWMLGGTATARIICTESNEENVQKGLEWMKKAGIIERVTYHTADAFRVISQTAEKFDMIFNDVDKEQYPEAFSVALAKLQPGGLLVTDNVLWDGRVADPDNNDPSTKAVREYNRLMFETPGVYSCLIPIRDGLGVTIKGI